MKVRKQFTRIVALILTIAILLGLLPASALAASAPDLDIIDYNHPDVLAYRHEGSQNLMVISSFRPYTTYFTFYYQIADVLLHNYDGVKIQDHVFELRPFESLLLKLR